MPVTQGPAHAGRLRHRVGPEVRVGSKLALTAQGSCRFRVGLAGLGVGFGAGHHHHRRSFQTWSEAKSSLSRLPGRLRVALGLGLGDASTFQPQASESFSDSASSSAFAPAPGCGGPGPVVTGARVAADKPGLDSGSASDSESHTVTLSGEPLPDARLRAELAALQARVSQLELLAAANSTSVAQSGCRAGGCESDWGYSEVNGVIHRLGWLRWTAFFALLKYLFFS